VKKRFDVYQKQTAPLVEYYEAQGIVHPIDAQGEIDDKVAEILKILESAKA